MAAPLRQLDAGSFYHVVSRGNNGGWIVRDALDRASFRSRLHQVAGEHSWEVVAWCLMTTHEHFVLRAPEGAISTGMRALNSRHAIAMNRRHGRWGHLYENRFFSVEIATQSHLVASVAYVSRNPVAAFAVERAEDWCDSSYRAALGLEPAPPWLAVDLVLAIFGRTAELARAELEDRVHFGRVPSSEVLEAVRRYEAGGAATELALVTTG